MATVEKYNHVCQYKFVKFIALLRLFSILFVDCMHIVHKILYGEWQMAIFAAANKENIRQNGDRIQMERRRWWTRK